MKRGIFVATFGVLIGVAARAQDATPSGQDEHQHHQVVPPGASSVEHVPPDPPKLPMGDMSYKEMVEQMQMDDTARIGQVLVKESEWRNTADSVIAWDAAAWYGGDYNKALIESEGDYREGVVEDANAEFLWDRIVARWWSVRAGARVDFGVGPSKSWAAIGLAGVAPYWFGIEATAYVGEKGRTALRLEIDYELLLTRRLILEPTIETNFYGKNDRERAIGSGLADIETGLRLRYEIRPEFAPYLGANWVKRFGHTATFARAAQVEVDDLSFVAGVRFWF